MAQRKSVNKNIAPNGHWRNVTPGGAAMGVCASKIKYRVVPAKDDAASPNVANVAPASSPASAAMSALASGEGGDENSGPGAGSTIIERRDKNRAPMLSVTIPSGKEEAEEAKKYSIHTPASVNARLGGVPTDVSEQAPWQRSGGSSGSKYSSQRVTLPTIMSDRTEEPASGWVPRPPPTPDNKLPPPIMHDCPPPPPPADQTFACSSCTERDGASASHWASYNGHLRCLELLLEGQDDQLRVDARGRTAMFYAVGQGHFNVTALLLDLRPEWIDQADNKGDTPVHVASCYGQQQVLNLLLESAADTNVRNNRGFTAAHVTASAECLGSLINYGADLMQGDKMGRTPLFCAAATSRHACVTYLCEASGAYAAEHHGQVYTEAADYRGDTPLHAAVCNNNVQCVSLLLQYTHDPSRKNGQGLTPLDLSIANGFEEVSSYLLQYGARPGTEVADEPQQQAAGHNTGPETPVQSHEASGGNEEDDWVQTWDEASGEWRWERAAAGYENTQPDAGAHHPETVPEELSAPASSEQTAATEPPAPQLEPVDAQQQAVNSAVQDVVSQEVGSVPLMSPSSQLKGLKREFKFEREQLQHTEDLERRRQKSVTMLKLHARRASRAGLQAATDTT